MEKAVEVPNSTPPNNEKQQYTEASFINNYELTNHSVEGMPYASDEEEAEEEVMDYPGHKRSMSAKGVPNRPNQQAEERQYTIEYPVVEPTKNDPIEKMQQTPKQLSNDSPQIIQSKVGVAYPVGIQLKAEPPSKLEQTPKTSVTPPGNHIHKSFSQQETFTSAAQVQQLYYGQEELSKKEEEYSYPVFEDIDIRYYTEKPKSMTLFDEDDDSASEKPNELLTAKAPQIKGEEDMANEYSILYEHPEVDLNIQFSVINPTKIRQNLKTYTQYTIKVTPKQTIDYSGVFQVIRRYKDFHALKKVLSQKFPGIYIPAIPLKKAIVSDKQGNLDQTFIEQRRVLLEIFLQKCAELEYIRECDEFQDFIRQSGSYRALYAKYQAPNLQQICANYMRVFAEFNKETPESSREVIVAFQETLFKEGRLVETAEGVAERSKRHFGAFLDTFEDLNTRLCTVQDFHVANLNRPHVPRANGPWNRHTNPYDVLHMYLKSEALDNMAMNQALAERIKLQQQLSKVNDMFDKQNKKLCGIQAGRKTLSSFFSPKSREYQLNKAQADFSQLKDTITYLETILYILTNKLIENDIPNYQATKLNAFSFQIKRYWDTSETEFKDVSYIQLISSIRRFNYKNQQLIIQK